MNITPSIPDDELMGARRPDRPERDSPTAGHGMDPLAGLEAWVAARADDDVEHHCSIAIETLEDGWSVVIGLEGTELETRTFAEVERHRDQHDWMVAWRDAYGFRAFCGARGLSQVARSFLAWATEDAPRSSPRAGARFDSEGRP